MNSNCSSSSSLNDGISASSAAQQPSDSCGDAVPITPTTGDVAPAVLVAAKSPEAATKPKRPYKSARSVFQPFDLDEYLLKKKLCKEAEDFVRAAEAQRSRHPNGYLSATVLVPCAKYGYTVIAESRGYEYPAVLTALTDPSVSRVWDQPPQVTVCARASSGKAYTFQTTPDLLVVKESGEIEIWEVKPAARLAELCLKHPNRYQFDGKCYRSAPLEQHFATWGITVRMVTEFNLDKSFVCGARFLQPYISGVPSSPISEEEHQAFLAAASETPGILLSEIPIEPPARRAEVFYYLIARGEIFTDLSDGDLTQPQLMRVYPTARDERAFALFRSGQRKTVGNLEELGYILKPGSLVEVSRVEYEVVRVTKTAVLLRDEEGETRTMPTQAVVDLKARIGGIYRAEKTFELLFSEAPIADRAAYYHRRKAIAPYIGDDPVQKCSPKSGTIRKWLGAYRCEGDRGLLPKHYKCGNRAVRMPADAACVLERLLHERYLKPGKKESVNWLYLEMVAAKGRGEISSKLPSKRAVYRHCEALDKYRTRLKRGGKRVALVAEPIFALNDIIGSPHGQRDFQIAHIDSTVEDLSIVHAGSATQIVKRYIATMVDAFTGEILAIHRSKGSPSGATIRALILDCLARHNTLPAVIVFDWGSEHRTVWLANSLLRFGVTLQLRPKASPRKGAPVESLFSVMVRELYHNLQGTTVLLQKARMVTKAVDPKQFTCWTDQEMDELLEEYIFLSNNLERSSKPSAISVSEACRNRYGPPPYLSYSQDEVRLALLPYVRGRTRKVSERGTIRVGKNIYFDDALRKFAGKDVVVRQDPEPGADGVIFVNPPGRERIIECRRIDYGGPSEEIFDEAECIDQQTLGPSPIPEVSTSVVLHANFVAKIESKQDAKKALARKKRAESKPEQAGADNDLPKFTLTSLSTIFHHD